ncbi:MAG: CoA transferase, partial [Deltaproteobacteria bacterium]|nr:CoA transferase [Deltaproteobacteria bacterium]
MAGAFDGVRVLDMTEGVAGPLACMLLADLHADVVRVESPSAGASAPDPGALCWNRNKRRIELAPAERENLDALLCTADVVVFDRPDAERAEQGLDAASLLERDPRLLVASLPHWGAAGWWSDLPVDDVLLWGLSGAAFSQFSWKDVPVQLVTPQLRYAHGMLAASAIAAALVERAQSGLGQHVEVNGLHALGGLQSGAFLRAVEAPRRRGIGTRGTLPNYRLYRCADGEWLFLATLIPHHFLKALDAIGLGSVLELPGVEGRFENVMQPGTARQVRDMIEARFAERDRAEWLATLHAHGVPSGPVGTRREWFDGETVAANEMRVDLEHPDLGPVSIPGVPAKLHDTPGAVRHLMQTVPLQEVLAEERPTPEGLAP